MIDIENAKKEFKKYVSNYNPEHPRVALKIDHIERVAENCKILAESLNLPEEEIKLAELIGYFHDLGRFEQVRVANTFSDRDSGINHGEYSVKVLFEDGLIRNYIQDTKYDSIIKEAILNHNRASINPNLSEKEMLFSKIIRDADKLDIFYNITFSDINAMFWYEDFDCKEINPTILKQFEEGDLVDYDLIKNNADLMVAFYAYIYDLYFEKTLQIVKSNNYLDTFYNRAITVFTSPKVLEQLAHIHEIYKKYMNTINV